MDDLLPALEAIVVASVAMTARALGEAGAELTIAQWRVIVVLDAAPEPVTIGALARGVGASPSAMSRLVSRLVARGYAEPAVPSARRDRRERHVSVSADGRALVRRIVEVRDRELSALPIDPADRPAVVRLGDAFTAAEARGGA